MSRVTHHIGTTYVSLREIADQFLIKKKTNVLVLGWGFS